MKRILFFVVIAIVAISCNFTTKEKSYKAENPIEEKIKKVMDENNVPGLSIGIIRNGKIDILQGFGTKSRKDTTKVNESSIFQIASQSKMFTGIIINNLIQEGKLNLEEPITSYFPSDINENAKKRLHKIKLKFLLNHTSGISSDACFVYSERIDGDAWTKGYSKEQLIKDINNIKLEFEPSSQFQYSNSGYAIVGFICETVSNLSYGQLLEKYVTLPYKLNNTSVKLSDSQILKLVTPYRKDNRTVETKPSNMGMATPASAIYSNATDLTKILSEQIKAYRLYDSLNEQGPLILTKQTSKMDEKLQYGFGLIKMTGGSDIKYSHGGDADGFACEYFFSPQKNNGVVILTSSGGRWLGKLADGILENLK
ncbi:class A beta-lactamase-related serine hydrolase [Polaribacter sp. WD7]|uniref:serine hydrolase domain-containing protein n=1 Tax=Polaribacter sp. WD7 TaxID=2269061 RepID=UPI000DF23AE6|nr:serine hydrolase domain-containing protein [Polaribacter sp. WD7]RCS28184.1 class A beta-lactamase-related serine hydrolase [Polaribacter sp. WD7]